jgi:hypothetical protein
LKIWNCRIISLRRSCNYYTLKKKNYILVRVKGNRSRHEIEVQRANRKDKELLNDEPEEVVEKMLERT